MMAACINTNATCKNDRKNEFAWSLFFNFFLSGLDTYPDIFQTIVFASWQWPYFLCSGYCVCFILTARFPTPIAIMKCVPSIRLYQDLSTNSRQHKP